jgi:hypothetical protein
VLSLYRWYCDRYPNEDPPVLIMLLLAGALAAVVWGIAE